MYQKECPFRNGDLDENKIVNFHHNFEHISKSS